LGITNEKKDYGDDVWLFMKQKSKDGVQAINVVIFWFILGLFELSYQISSV
jgi:hypothetical protein